MSGKYKVVKMKDIAKQLQLLSSRQFSAAEEYLEYALKEINEKSKYYFHQYLFLSDVLYVILVLKSSVDVRQTGQKNPSVTKLPSAPKSEENVIKPVSVKNTDSKEKLPWKKS